MESIAINLIIGFWLVAFGAMALFPLLGASGEPRQHANHQERDDQIISIHPVRPVQHWTPSGLADTSDGPIDDPDHRHAA